MALKLGSLFVSLEARSTGLVRGMAQAAAAVEKFSKEVKRASADAAQVAGVFALVGAAALRLAAQVDGTAKRSMDELTKSSQLLAVQVADMLLPAVQKLSELMRQAASFVAGLDPELKKQVSTFAVLAVQVAVAAKALSLFAGVGANIAGVVKGIAGALAALGVGPLLIIAALIAGVVALHYAWRTNIGGIADKVKAFMDWLGDRWGRLIDWLNTAVLDWADTFLAAVQDVLKGLGRVMQAIGKTKLGDQAFAAADSVGGVRQSLASETVGSLATKAFDIGKDLANAFTGEVKLMFDEVVGKMKSALGGGGAARGPGGAAGAIRSGALDSALLTARHGALAGSLDDRALQGGSVGSRAIGAMRAPTGAQALDRDVAAGAAEEARITRAIAAKKTEDMFTAIGNSLLPALGRVGDMINAAVQGFQQGGVWGAIAAMFAQVLQQVESAVKFLGVAMEFVEQLAAMIEPLVKPIFDALTNVLGIVLEIVEPIFKSLVPLFESIGGFVKQLAPILYAVGGILEGLAPIIELIGNVVGVILKALQPIIELISGVLKVIATVILGIIIALNEIAAAFGDEAARAESARLKGVVDRLWSTSSDAAVANGEAAGAALAKAAADKEAAKAAREVTEALTNVPAGFKMNGYRFAADMGIEAGSAWSGGGSGNTYIENVIVDGESVEDVAEEVRREQQRRRAQSTGNRNGGRGGRGGRGNGPED